VGDAPTRFRDEALALCEKLAASYQAHFEAKGVRHPLPERPLTLVTLKSRASYKAFKEGPVSETEGGYYDLDADRLVIFDFQDAEERKTRDLARRINTLALVHESIHQLTFATGLLRRDGDVPLVVSEGLATYGELWQSGRPSFGQVNRPRLAVLADPKGGDWIPLEDLIVADGAFDNVETEQMAYAEAWLLAYHLLKTKAGAAQYNGFLDRIRPRYDPSRRVFDATESLGELGRLDRALKKAASLLIRR
jgi:hypothetical protein